MTLDLVTSSRRTNWLPFSVAVGGALLSTSLAADNAPVPAGKAPAAKAPAAKAPAAKATVHTSPYKPDRFAGRAGMYYKLVWGVESLSTKWAESGEIIRFSYRVVDANKAKPLGEKRSDPSLIDPAAGVKLVVPTMENIGQLRQGADPEAGKSYWIAFSNKGRLVKRGDRVIVEIGQFHADGLVVD